jgi:serine/threonine-protein kinase
MSEVRDGWDLRRHRPVAIKLLHPMYIEDPVTRSRFENVALAASSLSHPHIVAVLDSGDHDGTPYIVMERLSGRTLADVIAAGPMPQAHVAAILDDVLSALAAAHAAGILHRDIKPANILFTDSGAVKVADFGIAKSAATPHTMTGQIVGTMAYLSPERIAGLPATPADDLYAVGVVGYEALTGLPPFPQQSLPELARVIAEGRRTPLSVMRPDVAPALAMAIDHAMDPQSRFASANDMRAALAGQPVPRTPTRMMAAPLPPPATVMVPPHRPRSRRRKVVTVAAAIAAGLVAVAAVFADTASRTPQPQPAGTTSTTLPTPVTPTVLPPPPPPSTPVPVEDRPKGPGNGGHGPKPKPKHGHGGD